MRHSLVTAAKVLWLSVCLSFSSFLSWFCRSLVVRTEETQKENISDYFLSYEFRHCVPSLLTQLGVFLILLIQIADVFLQLDFLGREIICELWDELKEVY